MKNILLIGTGGTIASELGAGGLIPVLTTEELARLVPEIGIMCNVTCIQLFSIDSTNITPAHWLRIAAVIEENYESYDGFVITHGTDTMAYTAAALSYLIQGSSKPIVLTGAQKPIVYENTDSKSNLADAFRCATSGICGVTIVFNGKILLGTRARKVRTTSFEAFSSINYPVLGVIQDGYLMEYIRPKALKTPFFSHTIDEKVGLVKLVPGMDPGVLEYLFAQNDAVIIEGFGVGGLPTYQNDRFYEVTRKAVVEDKKIVVMTTQVQNEGSNLKIYGVGNALKNDLKLLEAYDMTTESVYAKLMWIMGKTKEPDEVRSLFVHPIANDCLKRS